LPSLTFVLPHWLYWSVLAFFPAVALLLVHRQQREGAEAGRANHFLAYLFLVTAGFIGMHRFYLRSAWGFVFIPVFLVLLWSTAVIRDEREIVSRTRSDSDVAERVLTRTKAAAERQPDGAAERVADAEAKATAARDALAGARDGLAGAERTTHIIAGLLALMLIGDAFLVPGLVRRVRAREPAMPIPDTPLETAVPETPLVRPPAPFAWIDRVVRTAGEWTAYWAVLAVFAYYYEVVGRYVFNSPTNWVHESMFLMFGMQYMLAGAYAYRDETHVRVDIVYSRLSARGKAICDVITSAFFFLFTGTMLWTGWRFASDSIAVGEHSFTEWGIQYWPVKLAIPVGAALIILQGIARLARDVAILARREG
jgi:TRAP-type mannitol/chloroaromatic compound transport system permease small subunit